MVGAGSILQGRYRIEQPVGRGGMALVYSAWDLQFNQRVAVKQVLVPECTPEQLAAVLAQFEQEARVLRSLKHENIPNVYGFFTEQGETFLVMDFVEGRTLQSLVSVRPDGTVERLPSPTDVLDWGLQIARALDYLHTLKPLPVIYKDLKPGNVMLTPEGKLMLLDFGLAKGMSHTGESATILKGAGTPGYSPPEQFGADDQSADPRSDLYALGATLFFLLKGARPPDPSTQLEAHREMLRLLNSGGMGLPPDVERLLARLLAPRREDRIQTAREVADQLDRILTPAGAKPLATSPTLPDSTIALPLPPPEPKKTAGVALVTIGVGTALLLGWQLSGSRKPAIDAPPAAAASAAADVPTPTPTLFKLDNPEE